MGIGKAPENASGRICPRCQYQRDGEELAPEWQCPKCQIVYEKFNPTEHPNPPTKTPPSIVRKEVDQGSGSPLPWLGLILVFLIGGGIYLYDYFRWPDSDKITLFTANNCGAGCEQASDFLRQKGISFSEKNIDQDRDHFDRWKRAGGRQVPLAFFGDERIEGYNKTIYQIALTGYKDRMADNLNQTVILFSAAGCPGCESAVKLLRKYKVEFEEYDISEPENKSVYRELFGRGTPLIFVGNIRLDGFSEETLKLALGQVDLL